MTLHVQRSARRSLCELSLTNFLSPTAKRAYLTLLSSPPPALQATATSSPSLKPYTGPETQSILQAVQARPRSRSNAGAGGHSRKGSLMGSSGGGVLAGSMMGAVGGGQGMGSPSSGAGHGRSLSFGRDRQARGGSFGQKQMRDMMDSASAQEGDSALDTSRTSPPPPPVPRVPEQYANGGDRGGSPVQERRAGPSDEERRRVQSSPTSGSHRRSGKSRWRSRSYPSNEGSS